MNDTIEKSFKIGILIFLFLLLALLRQHFRAECVAELTAQDGKSVNILRLSKACEDLGYRPQY